MAVLAPSLVRCRSELNARWPSRDRRTDGWIGDTTHKESGRPENGGSDHNPNYRELVDAIDIDVDGIDCPAVVALLIRHPSVNYVIWNRIIWSRSHGFVARRYTGSNPHIDHIHVSILQTVAAENSTVAWGIATTVVVVPVVQPNPGPTELSWAQRLYRAMPVLRQSTAVRGSARKLQALLNLDGAGLTVDGGFGPKTLAAVRGYQQRHGLTVDGVVGAKTWGSLIGDLATVRRGSKGAGARRAQALLNVFGAGLKVDGDYGGRTEAAAEKFQRRYGLSADGVTGPVTWSALLTR